MSNGDFLRYYKEYLENYKSMCRKINGGCQYLNKNISRIQNYSNRDDIYEIGVVCLYSYFI
jgi:hypothetical protein